MWSLWRTAKETSSRPSDLLCVEDRLAAYQLDAAVVTFGTIVENLLQETVKVGPPGHQTYESKYTITQVLEPTFKVNGAGSKRSPASSMDTPFENGLTTILALAEQHGSGVKKWGPMN